MWHFLRSIRTRRATLPLRMLATGVAYPERHVTADELDTRLGRPPGTTLHSSGVEARYLSGSHETQSELGARALHAALDRAGLDAAGIDLLLGACGVPEQALPSTACAIAAHARLADGTPAFDVNASCLSFLAALHQAAALLATGHYRRIAIVSADLPSRGVDWAQPHASSIFGDGAAAVIVERGDGRAGILAYRYKTYPAGRRHCEIRAGGTLRNPRNGVEADDYLFQMDGRAAFRLASQVLPPLMRSALVEAGVALDDVDTVVPHQASRLAMDHLARQLKIDTRRLVDIYARHGNQVAASLPTALDHANDRGALAPGKHLMLLGTAAGLSAGVMVLRT